MSEPTTALLLGKREVARLLGISVPTFERVRAKGEFLAPVQFGRKPMWSRRAVEAWVDMRMQRANQEGSVELGTGR